MITICGESHHKSCIVYEALSFASRAQSPDATPDTCTTGEDGSMGGVRVGRSKGGMRWIPLAIWHTARTQRTALRAGREGRGKGRQEQGEGVEGRALPLAGMAHSPDALPSVHTTGGGGEQGRDWGRGCGWRGLGRGIGIITFGEYITEPISSAWHSYNRRGWKQERGKRKGGSGWVGRGDRGPNLWQVWDRAQMQGLEDVEEAPDDLGVVAGHGGVPQVAHQGVDRDCGVVVFTAGHQARCRQQVPSILAVPANRPCAQGSRQS